MPGPPAGFSEGMARETFSLTPGTPTPRPTIEQVPEDSSETPTDHPASRQQTETPYTQPVSRSLEFQAPESIHPSAVLLSRAFLITTNHITNSCCAIYMDELPSGAKNGVLIDPDWARWQYLLRTGCGFDPASQLIRTRSQGQDLDITNRALFRSACLLHLGDMMAEEVRGSPRIQFDIIKRNTNDQMLSDNEMDPSSINNTGDQSPLGDIPDRRRDVTTGGHSRDKRRLQDTTEDDRDRANSKRPRYTDDNDGDDNVIPLNMDSHNTGARCRGQERSDGSAGTAVDIGIRTGTATGDGVDPEDNNHRDRGDAITTGPTTPTHDPDRPTVPGGHKNHPSPQSPSDGGDEDVPVDGNTPGNDDRPRDEIIPSQTTIGEDVPATGWTGDNTNGGSANEGRIHGTQVPSTDNGGDNATPRVGNGDTDGRRADGGTAHGPPGLGTKEGGGHGTTSSGDNAPNVNEESNNDQDHGHTGGTQGSNSTRHVGTNNKNHNDDDDENDLPHLSKPARTVTRDIRRPSMESNELDRDVSDKDNHSVVVISDEEDAEMIEELDDEMEDPEACHILMHESIQHCGQLNKEIWREFQSFFMLPHGTIDGTDPRTTIPVMWMKRQPFPYQLFAAFWMLQTERGLEMGGFLSDEMGLGKTMTAITYFVLSVHILRNHEHVRQHPERHLANDNSSDKCPLQHKFPFRCSCISSVYSARKLEPRPGPTLFVVPTSLLSVWLRQWADTIDKSSPLRLVFGHGPVPTKDLDRFEHCGILARDSPDALALQPNDAEDEDDEKPINATRFAVVTTSGSCHHARRLVESRDERNKVIVSRDWRALVRDESHLDKRAGSGTVNLFSQLIPSQGSPAIWLLSGTPYDRGPIDIRAWVGVLEGEGWQADKVLSLAANKKFHVLANRVHNNLSRGRGPSSDEWEELRADARTLSQILERIMIRRESETTWFGKQLVDLPPNEHRDISCPLGDGYMRELQRHEERVMKDVRRAYERQMQNWHMNPRGQAPRFKPSSFFQRSRKIRMVAIFPGLLDLMRHHDLELTKGEIAEAKSDKSQSVYHQNINMLVNSSRKCQWIKQLLWTMEGSTDHAGRPEKLMIVTSFPVVVHVLQEWLMQLGYETAAIESEMGQDHRDAIVESFNNDMDITLKGRTLGCSPRILIGTMDLVGVGFTCVRAFRLVLMGPEWLQKVEHQAMARIRRIGQGNLKTYTYRLVCEDVRIEKGIIQRHELRREFHEIATQIKNKVEGGQASERERVAYA